MPRFMQVDVFTAQKYMGNPVAVFFDAENLTTEEMKRMSTWTNLSEATFVHKPTVEGADYKVRIFSLDEELPFAGHPTLGTCHALVESGVVTPKDGKIYQQCDAGLVEISVKDGKYSFKLPYAKRQELSVESQNEVEKALKGPAILNLAIYDVGPVWLTAELASGADVVSLKPDSQDLSVVSKKLGVCGVQVIGPCAEEASYQVRTFAPAIGLVEDPACGSGAGATGAHLREFHGKAGGFSLSQGISIGRDAKIDLHIAEKISVGGNAVTVIEGTY
ncbi:hypothetical protein PUMCH_000580 [Australozyma saopauloensis]|uniref:Uncharacterized protein n=1 Tax=Australozyma saopauloensis TaxID=291208 RepID=A0AAX4H459_9ASCO|nr:hypothetical protein PUMCH_000580 [[Candida] saopauloensis]